MTPAEASSDSLRVTRLLRWAPLFIMASLFVVVLRTASRPLDNPDTFFHLRFGSMFLSEWTLRSPGSVTTFATRDWLPTQWLPQTVMAQLENSFGLAGVAWFAGLTYLAYTLAVYLVCRSFAPGLVAAFITILTTLASLQFLDARPQVISYLFILITTWAWLRRARGTAPWFLIPMTWLWAMCHGMWPVGPLIGLVALVGVYLDERPSRRGLVLAAAVPLGSLAVAGLTPVGPGLYSAVVFVGGQQGYFSEWAPPDFTTMPAIAVLVVLALGLVIRLRQGPAPWTEALLTLFALVWAVYAVRTVPVAAAMLAPLLAISLRGRVVLTAPDIRGDRRAAVVMALVSAVLLVLVVAPNDQQGPAIDRAVDDRLDTLPGGTRVLDDWGWGGYFIWRHPELDFVMHGYGDAYEPDELARNSAITNLAPGWDLLVAKTGADHAVLEQGSALAYALEHTLDWDIAVMSDQWIVLDAPASAG